MHMRSGVRKHSSVCEVEPEHNVLCIYRPYLLDQSPLSISHHSRIEAAPPDARKETVAALE